MIQAKLPSDLIWENRGYPKKWHMIRKIAFICLIVLLAEFTNFFFLMEI